ncbi:MAG: AI-2E family transporter [Desulfuromonadaceae bacterium]|nr:AI-2E family transporter [Desulfuromonadaceae bacterium]
MHHTTEVFATMDRSLFSTLMAYTFALLLIYLLYSILSPFLAPLVWACAIGVITRPLYEKLLLFFNGREIIASLLLTLAVVLAVVLPLVGLILTLSNEAALAYQYLEKVTAGGPTLAVGDILHHPLLLPWLERARALAGSLNLNVDLDAMLLPAIKKGIAAMLEYSTGIVKNFLAFLFKLVLMVITLFFVYKDGAGFLHRFWLVVPIRERLRTAIIETVARVLRAVMYGIVLTSLVQGTLGGLGFWVAGLPSPVMFGVLMAICAVIPVVGTALIWLPGALYLLVQGQTMPGFLLIAWGVVVISSIDNFIRPFFISGKAKLHLLVIMLGALGGLLAFGVTGVVAGPVALALVIVFFEESRQETVQLEK